MVDYYSLTWLRYKLSALTPAMARAVLLVVEVGLPQLSSSQRANLRRAHVAIQSVNELEQDFLSGLIEALGSDSGVLRSAALSVAAVFFTDLSEISS